MNKSNRGKCNNQKHFYYCNFNTHFLCIVLLKRLASLQSLTHFRPMFSISIQGFLTFSGSIEMKYWAKMG